AASLRVILGSATADLLLLLPAFAFAWVIRSLERAALWVGAGGALFLLVPRLRVQPFAGAGGPVGRGRGGAVPALAGLAGGPRRQAAVAWGPAARRRPLGVFGGGRREPGQPPHLDVLAG